MCLPAILSPSLDKYDQDGTFIVLYIYEFSEESFLSFMGLNKDGLLQVSDGMIECAHKNKS